VSPRLRRKGNFPAYKAPCISLHSLN